MKEAEMDALAMPWVNARAAHLLAIRRMAPVKVESDCNGGCITRQDRFMMHTQKVETLEPFSSHVIPMKTMVVHVGECLNVMVRPGWHLTTWPNHAEHVYRTEEGH